jgi:hypothetical protein
MKIYPFKKLASILSIFFIFCYLIIYLEFQAQSNEYHINENATAIVINLKSNNFDSIKYDADIVCRNSSIKNIHCTICLHELDKDVYVSGTIWRDGVWEPHILSNLI